MNKKQFLPFLLTGAFLRLFLIWRPPLWYDENFTLLVSRLPFERMLAAVAGDVHPPLWYLITWGMDHLGGPAWLIRLPAALIGILSLYVFWILLQDLAISTRVQYVAMGLFVISPAMIYYSQEGRMYSLLALLVMIAFHSAWFGKWGRFTLSAIAMYYTQVYAVFYLAAIVLAVLIRERGQWRPLLKTGLIVSLAGLPWSFVTLSQMNNIEGNYWISQDNPGSLVYTLTRLFFAWSLSGDFETWGLIAVIFLFAALTVAIVYVIRKKQAGMMPIFIMTFAPPLLALIASWIWQPVLLHRPLIGILPFMFILLAMPVDWILRDPFRSAFAIGFILPIMGAALIGVYTADVRQSDQDGLNYILSNWQPGDIIYHYSDGTYVNWTPYLGDLAQYQYMQYPCAPTLGSLSMQTREALEIQFTPLENIPYKRSWVIWGESPLTPDCQRDHLGQLVYTMQDNEWMFLGVWLNEH